MLHQRNKHHHYTLASIAAAQQSGCRTEAGHSGKMSFLQPNIRNLILSFPSSETVPLWADRAGQCQSVCDQMVVHLHWTKTGKTEKTSTMLLILELLSFSSCSQKLINDCCTTLTEIRSHGQEVKGQDLSTLLHVCIRKDVSGFS